MGGFRTLFQSLALAPLTLLTPAMAQDAPADWHGAYVGYHLGGALDLAEVGDPFGPSIFGDTVRAPGPLAGGQIGYNWQSGAALLGVEADASWADLRGTNTCFAYSGYYVSANCRASVDVFGTFTGRLGWVLPSDGKTLIYGKAGLAWAYGAFQAVPNAGLDLRATEDSGLDWGWTVGGGIERAITPRWTVRAEYGLLSFDQDFVAPGSVLIPRPRTWAVFAVDAKRTDLSRDIHQFKLGMNYRLGSAGTARETVSPDSADAPGYRLAVGARYAYGWGQFHKDLSIRDSGIPRYGDASLRSRLTYETTDMNGGEVFARLDTPPGLMVKGFVGGAASGGIMTDEDWDIGHGHQRIAYSNTLSSLDNDIRYGVVDVGYAVWRGDTYSVAPLVGYTRLTQDMTAIDCRQIGNRFAGCVPTIRGPVITEDDTWEALRLGAVVDVNLSRRVGLSADAAYLPYVTFAGTDNHLLRNLVSPEDGNGLGIQLETTLSYALTDAIDVGIGARYWALWTTSADVNFGGSGQLVPMRFATEQAQLLLQGSYRFGRAP